MKNLFVKLLLLLMLAVPSSIGRAATTHYFEFSSGSTNTCPHCPLGPPLINCFTVVDDYGCTTDICTNSDGYFSSVECIDSNGNGSGEDQTIDSSTSCATVFTYEITNGHPHNFHLIMDGC